MAIAVLERASSPRWPTIRWPTIIIEMTCNIYCDRVTATIGPAKSPNLLISPLKVTHVRDGVSDFLFSSANKLSSMPFSVSLLKFILSHLTRSNVEQDRIEMRFGVLVFHFMGRPIYALDFVFFGCVKRNGDNEIVTFV